MIADTAPPAAVVSESRLLPLLDDQRICLLEPQLALRDPVMLEPATVTALVGQWQAQVVAGAKSLVKTTRGVLEELSSGSLYERLNDPRWKTAALICELFRSPDISKNAGWLATKQLQRRVVAALDAGGPLQLVIAWGQAKRDVGGLKTLGPLPDLAEIYAIGRLAMVVDAAARHLDGQREVVLKILGGSVRFNEALHTRPDMAHAYDQARGRIGQLLLGRPGISVQPFVPPPAVQAVMRGAAAGETAPEVDDHEVVTHFATVALNVDWGRFFTSRPDAGAADPHLPALPSLVTQWLARGGEPEAARLLRAAVTCTVNPRCRMAWEDRFPDADAQVLEAAAEFVRATAWQSTRQYLRVQALLREPGPAPDDRSIRLTVHEKSSRHDIPAIYTLGPQGGDQLSQHVVARLGGNGTLRFGPLAEFIQPGPVRPVRVAAAPPGSELDWLAGSMQPLCVAAPDADPVEDLLGRMR